MERKEQRRMNDNNGTASLCYESSTYGVCSPIHKFHVGCFFATTIMGCETERRRVDVSSLTLKIHISHIEVVYMRIL